MENKFVLSDCQLLELRNDTPYAEGDPIQLFYSELKAAANAIEKTGVKADDPRARVVQLVRAVYLLGIQRGAEAYRSYLLADDPCEVIPQDMPFILSCAGESIICDELNEEKMEILEFFYKIIGI